MPTIKEEINWTFCIVMHAWHHASQVDHHMQFSSTQIKYLLVFTHVFLSIGMFSQFQISMSVSAVHVLMMVNVLMGSIATHVNVL